MNRNQHLPLHTINKLRERRDMLRSLILPLLVLLFCVARATLGQSTQTSNNPALDLQGDIRNVHDPSVIKAGDTYYVFSTRAGLSVRCAKDLIHWRLCGDVFAHLPLWAVQDVTGLRGLWAPDISYFNSAYHLYYSVSTFGSNRSSIGLAINETLDPASDKFRWVDQGRVVSSYSTDDWNAIDPNVVLDEDGNPWLAFGSFWSGIKLRKLDKLSGKLDRHDETLYALAGRPKSVSQSGAIEAPFIVRRENFYYLFVSFDFCCRGNDSTYNVRVGRARKVTGPYVDRAGLAMREGGGTLVIAGQGRYRGTGHCAVLQEPDGDKLIYHAYDADFKGVPTLRISRLYWDTEGWPTINSVK